MRRLVVLLGVSAVACGRPTGTERAAEPAAPAGEQAETTVSREGPRYGLGRPADRARLAGLDTDIGPDGHGLPRGRGSVAEGEVLYLAQCANCHGAGGEGIHPVYPALVGREPREGFPFAHDPKLVHTIGNYWSHATTVVDYIRRAMPLTAPGSLTDDQVYALTAWLLAANEIIPMDAVLDSAAVMAVQMPARDRFVPDDRRGGPEVK